MGPNKFSVKKIAKKKLRSEIILDPKNFSSQNEIWVEKNFGKGWMSETEVSFSKAPISTFVAIKKNKIIGFCTYESAYLNFLGPMGVEKKSRKKGLGKALLFLALKAMKDMGYAYSIIGGVGPAKFYSKTFGAEIIKGSNPGIYKGILSHVPV